MILLIIVIGSLLLFGIIFGSYKYYNSDKMKYKREDRIEKREEEKERRDDERKVREEEKRERIRQKTFEKKRREKKREFDDEKERRREVRLVKSLDDDFKEIVGYTKFIYEDANTYYFRIIDRDSNSFHNLKCYSKKGNEYLQIGSEELISVNFNSSIIKKGIKDTLSRHVHKVDWADWDGFVGEIPNHIKREGRLKQLLDKEKKEKEDNPS